MTDPKQVPRQSSVATAESCTGGLLAGAFTEIAGSSAWFDQGWITYSNAAKQAQLGVASTTLAAHGAVSEPTAREMALGVLRAAPQAGWALATTGIAGPGGATPGKPVGLVCFGFARRQAGAPALFVEAETACFGGDRRAVRLAAVDHALRGLLQRLR